MSDIRERVAALPRDCHDWYSEGACSEDGCSAVGRAAVLAIIDESLDAATEVLRQIYEDARYRFDGSLPDGTPIRAGYCRWCGAPPPDEDHDHDVACPAGRAAAFLAHTEGQTD